MAESSSAPPVVDSAKRKFETNTLHYPLNFLQYCPYVWVHCMGPLPHKKLHICVELLICAKFGVN